MTGAFSRGLGELDGGVEMGAYLLINATITANAPPIKATHIGVLLSIAYSSRQ
jgi:hypothetical protein